MGREGELPALSSPQNKLKDILQTIFKRNDQQVAGDLIPVQACQEKALQCRSLTDAAPAADDATQGCPLEQCSGGLQDEGAAHLEQQPSCSSNHRGSVSTLDAFESAGAASLDGPHDGGAVKQHAMRSGTAVGGAAQPDCGLGAAGAPDHMNPAHSCAGAQATSDKPQPSAARSLRHHLGHLQETAAAPQNGLAQAAPHDSGLPMGPSGQQQQPMQRRAGSPAAVPHGYAAATMYSEPCPASSGGGGRTPCIPRKVLCASVDDLYQELFGDVPLPSASSSAAHSSFEGSLHNLRGVSSMSPMTTSSAFCHQHAAAAAIAGSGGMPGVGSFIHEVGAGPTPRSGASNRSSYSGVQSPLGGVVAGGRYGECAGMLPVVQPPHPMGDMLPLGAYPPRVRVATAPQPSSVQPQSSRCSASDGGSSSLFPEESPSCCSSGATGHPWPQEEVPSCAVSSLSSGQGCDSRGSLRYSFGSGRDGRAASPATAGSRHAGARTPEAPGTRSAPGTGDSKPAPKSSLRTRWTNWINSGGGAGNSSAGGRSASQQQLQVQPQQQATHLGLQEPHAAGLGHSRGLFSPRHSVLAPQSAPGNAADQALYASTGQFPRAGNSSRAGGVPGSSGILPVQPLAHCHSNPELVQQGAFGSVGHGRGQFHRASGLGGGVPPCARSLFGSVPQMERPLMMAGSVGNGGSNNSSGWLSGPGGVGFGVPPRSESFGVLAALDDAMSVASADDEVIRQVNADNVLSTAWGPGSHSASGGGMPGVHSAASHPKLLAFKYCCATSPLNHPGRSSPFNSARNSPFNSPRGTRDSVVDMVSLRSAAVAMVTASCPGSPLGARHGINPFSNSNSSTPADISTPAAAAAAEGTASAVAAADTSGAQAPQQQQQPQQGLNVLKKQGSSSSQVLLEPTVSGASDQQQLDGSSHGGSDAGTACSSSGGSNSSSKPPLQGRLLRGLLRTPPPPLPVKAPGSLPAAATTGQLPGWAADAQKRCATADAATIDSSSSANGDGIQAADSSTGLGPSQISNSAGTAGPGRGAGFSGNRRVSAPAGLSAFMMRFSSSSGNSNNSSSDAPGPANDSSSQSQSPGLATQGSTAGALDAASIGTPDLASSTGAAGSCSHSSKASERGIPLVLPNCSTDASSPKQQLQTTTSAGPEARCSPRRQSSSRLGASGGFTTPSRLSHNSAMAEALVTGSGGGTTGGFALQRTSSCCSSSSGWPSAAGGKLVSGGRSSSGGVAGLPGHDGTLLSTTSVPLPSVYHRGGSRSVNCSDSSDDSWKAGQSGYCAVQEGVPEQQGGLQQLEQAGEGAEWAEGSVACLAAPPAAAAVGRYDSGNGASDASVADCQECPYPSWCSSNCWSPLAPQQEQQDPHTQPLQASLQQQQHAQQREQQQQGYASQSLQGSAGGAMLASASADAAAVAEAAIPPSLPEVDFLDKIGRGSFGDVFKGVWCGSVVAVKVIQVRQPSALTFPNRPSTQPQQQQEARLQPLDNTTGAPAGMDSQAAQVALELAQHEYESWLNANLRHPNIVQLFTSFTIGLEERGASLPGCLFGHPDGGSASGLSSGGGAAGLSWKTHLVMEYCELGTMQDLLQRGVFSQGSLSGAAHLCWVLATAKEFCTAVSYLHSMDVVHGDLKSSNVLLKAAAATAWDSRGFVAKVSDFGLSRVMDAINAANGDPPGTPPASTSAPSTCNSSSSSTALAAAEAGHADAAEDAAGGSLGWQPCQPRFGALSHAAPELIRGQQLSKASDVFSIGVLLWELLSGQAPFYGMHPGQLLSLKLSQHTSQLLPFPATAPGGLTQLCLDCWAAEPSQRPSMSAVVQTINELAVSLLGQEQAVAMFPDVAASLAAQRRQAALAAAAAAGAGGCC